MKTVQLWTVLQRVQGHGDRQTPDYCTRTRAAFITAIYADAALSSLMDELKEK